MLHLDTPLSIENLELVRDLKYWFVKRLSVTSQRQFVCFLTLRLTPIRFDEKNCVWCILYSDLGVF